MPTDFWMSRARAASRSADGFTVAVAGAGGVIGSHLIPHLARNIEIATLVLIDVDDYETKNLASQDALPSDVGRPKALVQAERARRIRGSLEVIPIAADVESLPLGWLRTDLVLTCLDSRRSRQHVNLVTRRLGVPWLDAGVLGDQLLVRLDLFRPDRDTACLECRWSDTDYAALEQRYPCDPQTSIAAPSGSPSGLGALAAALQAIECGKQLAAEGSRLMSGEQVVLDATGQNLWRTKYLPHPACRIGSHGPWTTETLDDDPATLTLGRVFERARQALDARDGGVGAQLDRAELDRAHLDRPHRDPALRLSVEPQRFATEWLCEGCGSLQRDLRILSRTPARDLPCPVCSSTLHPLGLRIEDELHESRLSPAQLDLTLEAIGMVSGDVLSVAFPSAPDDVLHFELTAHAPQTASGGPRLCPWGREDRRPTDKIEAMTDTAAPDVADRTGQGGSPHAA